MITSTVQEQYITLHSRVGGDGRLQLDVPTQLTNTDLTVVVWVYPTAIGWRDQPETFSVWWSRQLADLPQPSAHAEQDLRFEYLAERYGL